VILSAAVSLRIITCARTYLGKPFDYERFNCVHFVRSVYRDAGIEIPLLPRDGFLPDEFNLTRDEFADMPLGHTAFFKRKATTSARSWSHMAIIVSSTELIHCTRHVGRGVVITPVAEFIEIYNLVPKDVS
jgi:cell wall-associated NlpC family hydrolase